MVCPSRFSERMSYVASTTTAPSYKGFRFPPEIISHAVWLYFRFSLSFRDVEELLAQRGIGVTYETVLCWLLVTSVHQIGSCKNGFSCLPLLDDEPERE